MIVVWPSGCAVPQSTRREIRSLVALDLGRGLRIDLGADAGIDAGRAGVLQQRHLARRLRQFVRGIAGRRRRSAAVGGKRRLRLRGGRALLRTRGARRGRPARYSPAAR